MEVRRGGEALDGATAAPASTYAQSDNVTRGHVAGDHWPARLCGTTPRRQAPTPGGFASPAASSSCARLPLLPTTPSETTRRASPGGWLGGASATTSHLSLSHADLTGYYLTR